MKAPSIWERNTYYAHADVIVIGGGITGLNAATFLKAQRPDWSVLVLERGRIPAGASTRNAGFACFGSVSELLADLAVMEEKEVMSLVGKRYAGLRRMRDLLGDERIGYEPVGNIELFRSAEQHLMASCLEALPQMNALVEAATGLKDVYLFRERKGEAENVASMAGVNGYIVNRAEGLVNTGKMMLAWEARTREMGVRILTGMEVTRLEEEQGGMTISVGDPSGNEEMLLFQAHQVLVANNGFARRLLPEMEVRPARNQVLLTHPIPGLSVKGGFHLDRGYFYFRNVGEQILVGGGRHLDLEGESTDNFGLHEEIQQTLEHLLRDYILPDQPVEIAMRWSGILGVGTRKSYLVKQLSNRIACAVRLGGMGVAIGGLLGESAAKILMRMRAETG